MMADKRTVIVNPYFGGFVLETLTVGMYGESRNAIREYIQNGFDSIQRAIKDLRILAPGGGLIEIFMPEDQSSLRIRDNGAGLSIDNAVSTLASIGASGKDYKSEAGFRGIGRLAGIVFSETVTFTTKAKGESEQTVVVFNAKLMRELMTPARGSGLSAEELLQKCVTAYREENAETGDHFFEVKLENLTDAPEECIVMSAMESFVSQVAPVPYSPDFPYRAQLVRQGETAGIPIEEVNVAIIEGAQAAKLVTKPFQAEHDVEEEGGCAEFEPEFFSSPKGHWWAWIGRKSVTGSYVDARVRGVRVRAKNIQIDGAEIVRDLFRETNKSWARLQDWYIGEIFVHPAFLVPNARRDGFEETATWKAVRRELAPIIRQLGVQAYELSSKGQMTVATLGEKLKDAEATLQSLRKSEFRNVDKTVALSADITKLQQRVARASKNADPETLADLQAIGSGLVDIKTEAISKLQGGGEAIDQDRVQQEARDELLKELVTLFRLHLGPPCQTTVINLVREQYGDEVL